MTCSIIYRGLYTDTVRKNIEHISTLYPECDIVLSTWDYEKQNTDKINKKVKIVLSKDPGPGPIQNLNRQTVLATAGLSCAEREYVFMCRTDVLHKKLPPLIFDNKIYYSSIMSVLYGHPCPHPERFFSHGKDRQYYCRFGDWYHYSKKENLLSLYSIFTEEEVKYCSNSVNCTEQYLFMREMLKNCEEKYYYRYIKEKTGIIDLKSIDGIIEKIPYKNKNDKEYHNQERHDYVIQGILANEW